MSAFGPLKAHKTFSKNMLPSTPPFLFFLSLRVLTKHPNTVRSFVSHTLFWHIHQSRPPIGKHSYANIVCHPRGTIETRTPHWLLVYTRRMETLVIINVIGSHKSGIVSNVAQRASLDFARCNQLRRSASSRSCSPRGSGAFLLQNCSHSQTNTECTTE